MKKRMISCMLIFTSVLFGSFGESAVCFAGDKEAGEENNQKEIKIEKQENQKEFTDLTMQMQSQINDIVGEAEQSGKNAAIQINHLNGDVEERNIAIREVFDFYYSADILDETSVNEFTTNLNENVDELNDNYAEARKERGNEENLNYIPGKEVIILKSNTSKQDIDKLIKNVADSYEVIWDNTYKVDSDLDSAAKERLKKLENDNSDIVLKVKLNLDQTVERAQQEFLQYECVETCVANEKAKGQMITNGDAYDFFSDDLWYLNRCNFTTAWKVANGKEKEDIVIAVLDSGCMLSHIEFEDRLVLNDYAVDVTSVDERGNYRKLADIGKQYDDYHGTFCTGIITARYNNGHGISGAACGFQNKFCKVLPIKMSYGCGADGRSQYTVADVYNAMMVAIQSGARVISMSVGGWTWEGKAVLQSAVNKVEKAGVVMVAAAGNDNTSSVSYPATLDYVIAVGGVDELGNKASFSNYGSWVDIVAPATNFSSTSVNNNLHIERNKNGTSFATPLVAATVGLMLTVNPDLTVSQVKQILYDNTVDMTPTKHNYVLTYTEWDYCYIKGEENTIYYYDCTMCNAGKVVCASGHTLYTNGASEYGDYETDAYKYFSCGRLDAGKAVSKASIYK